MKNLATPGGAPSIERLGPGPLRLDARRASRQLAGRR